MDQTKGFEKKGDISEDDSVKDWSDAVQKLTDSATSSGSTRTLAEKDREIKQV